MMLTCVCFRPNITMGNRIVTVLGFVTVLGCTTNFTRCAYITHYINLALIDSDCVVL